MKNEQRRPPILSIQVLRALAALMIVLLHTLLEAKSIHFLPQIRLDRSSTLNMGVDLFFVISGFVIALSSTDLFQQAGGARRFLLRRMARVIPLYWTATTLFLIVMFFSPDVLHSEAGSRWDVLRSYCFIPYGPDLSPVYKLGWTLNYEMFFYVCFASVLFLPRVRAVVGLTILFWGLTVAGMVFRPENSMLRFWTGSIILEFVMGAWIGLAFVRQIKISRFWAATVMTLAVALVLSGVWSDPGGLLGRSLCWGLPGALFVAGSTLGDFTANFAGLTPLVYLGDASYTLYLCHPFTLRLVKEVWLHTTPFSGAGLLGYLLGSLTTTVVVACLVHRYFERPLTRLVQNLFGVDGRQPVGSTGLPESGR